jgi:uncharacterized iron-regulated membrane protein
MYMAKKLTLRKIMSYLHLWVGLGSGVIIFIICITAAIWSFSPEIENATQAYRHVEPLQQSFLPISTLKNIADKTAGRPANRITLNGSNKAATADFYSKDFSYTAFINPYSGQVLHYKNNKTDFFGWIIEGHYSLWMGETGSQIVKWTTVLFVLMLVSGIVLWWPKNKNARKQRFTIKWKASPRRLNYDLHNVLGFYASWIVLFAALTGLVWMFDSLANAEWWLASGGQKRVAYPEPVVQKTTPTPTPQTIDDVFTGIYTSYPALQSASLYYPQADSLTFLLSLYPQQNYYSGDDYYINPYTLQQVEVAAFGKYARANGGEKLNRMNYDIHIGNILGFPGRMAMFLSVLIAASLPVTGFILWWGKNKKAVKNKDEVATQNLPLPATLATTV